MKKICFAVPGAKHYETDHYTNCRASFMHISVTGTDCSLRCEHCQGKLLEGMVPAGSPEEFVKLIDELIKKGCRGILVSGGADARGEVPLGPYVEGMGYARKRGLKVLVHCGLISRSTAIALQEAGVQQALLDIIGDEETIRRVYHLKNRTTRDYLDAMLNCREAGLDFAPHVVMGLNYGKLGGEYRALEMIQQAAPRVLVLVVLTPVRGTSMGSAAPIPVQEAGALLRHAREVFPGIITLGCAKPPGAYKEELERTAVDCGVDVIAFPTAGTVEYAQALGYDITYKEECCSACNI
ncbi:MAG: radical SAM protein [Clostridia bacterium]|jgi:uncharacterized radical SAM superfamily protein|nr:radical SAM protein [Clostridia bacterium]